MKNKLIIYAQSCRKDLDKRNWIRNSWMPLFEKRGVETYFSEGGHEKNEIVDDIIRLNVEDDYFNLFYKTLNGFKYLLENKEWDYLLKTDNDTSFSVHRTTRFFQKISKEKYDYVSTVFCGACCFFSRRAVEYVVYNIKDMKNWDNNKFFDGKFPWDGLERYVEKSKWINTIPDDAYMKKFCLDNKDLKTVKEWDDNVASCCDYNHFDWNLYRKYLAAHNFRDEETFLKYFKKMNNL